jgi:hypothetical protein
MNHVSLETAKRMKELGFNQDAHDGFVWAFVGRGEDAKWVVGLEDAGENQNFYGVRIVAPTVDEIMEKLPSKATLEKSGDRCFYAQTPSIAWDGKVYETPVEALAHLWCKLRENGIILDI